MKGSKLKVALLHTQNTGVGMWRMIHPAKWINRLGLAEVRTLPFYFRSHNSTKIKDPFQRENVNEMLEPICSWADIIVVMRRDTQEHTALMATLLDINSWSTGDIRKPIVLETDDFVQYVPPYNPGAKYYRPGTEQTDRWANQIIQMADSVIVSTPGLKNLYKQFSNKIYVVGNYIDPEFWAGHPEPEPHPGEVRIGWAGANAHWGDLRILREVMTPILDKYPQVKFHFVGQLPEWWYDDLAKKRIVNYKFHNLANYAKFLHSLHFDIGIAPLMDNLFNRGKSNIRWIEYSVNKAAVVASPVQAYTKDPLGLMKDNVNVLFAKEKEDWIKKLSFLIENEAERKRIATQANNDVMTKYNLETEGAKHYVEVLNEIYAKFYAK